MEPTWTVPAELPKPLPVIVMLVPMLPAFEDRDEITGTAAVTTSDAGALNAVCDSSTCTPSLPNGAESVNTIFESAQEEIGCETPATLIVPVVVPNPAPVTTT